MPHDKVVRGRSGELLEAVVHVEGGHGGGVEGLKVREELQPLQDPVITRYLQVSPPPPIPPLSPSPSASTFALAALCRLRRGVRKRS